MPGAKYQTMDPNVREGAGILVKKKRYRYCPNRSHLTLPDDLWVFLAGVIKFICDEDAKIFLRTKN